MGPNYYPPGGHDWVGTDEIRRAAEHNEALLAEKYAHDVAAFRGEFYSKLVACSELFEGFGWAIFHGEEQEGSVATMAQREVLLVSRIRRDAESDGEFPLPVLRLITNEPVVTEGGLFYLTEDVSILEGGQAYYFMDAVHVTDEEGETETQDFQSGIITRSASPIFLLNEGRLVVSSNGGYVTPTARIRDTENSLSPVSPYGDPNGTVEDHIYALGKAGEILRSVQHTDPSHWYQRAA